MVVVMAGEFRGRALGDPGGLASRRKFCLGKFCESGLSDLPEGGRQLGLRTISL